MASTATDPAREYRLIEQVELRIASAKDDEAFENVIGKYLPAIILKLASETERNRNLAIKVCQYVNQRLKISQSIQVPVAGLFKNLREAQNAFVRRFSLLFIEQGLGRVKPSQSLETLEKILQHAVPQADGSDDTVSKMWAIGFDLLLDTLKTWKAPERHSKEDQELKTAFNLTDQQCGVLCRQLSQFVIYDPKIPLRVQPGTEYFQPIFDKQFRQRQVVVAKIADFLFTSIFTDENRLIPATILSVDANAGASNKADIMFKQCIFDFESTETVEALYDLFDGSKPKLQTKILSLLSRSQKSTEHPSRIFSIIDRQLNSQDTSLEASKLRGAIFTYLNWAVRVSSSIHQISRQTQAHLKSFVELQGWPTARDQSQAEADLRAKAYESIGLLSSLKSTDSMGEDVTTSTFDLITWLFTSLRCDTTRDIRSSIEEALSRMMNDVQTDDVDLLQKLRELLLWNVTAQPGDEDPVYYLPTINSTKYTAVRFANKCLPFSDTVARFIDVIACVDDSRKELGDEGRRGLDPYWHQANQKLKVGQAVSSGTARPQFQDLLDTFFGNDKYQQHFKNKTALNAAVLFCRNILICEALSDTSDAIKDTADWQSTIDALLANSLSTRTSLRKYLSSVPSTVVANFVMTALRGLKLQAEDCAETALVLLSLANDSATAHLGIEGTNVCIKSLSDNAMQYRAARCLGIMLSSSSNPEVLAGRHLEECSKWFTSIGTEAVTVRGRLLAATFVATRGFLRQPSLEWSDVRLSLSELLRKICLESSDTSLKNAAMLCLGQVALFFPPSQEIDGYNQELVDLLMKESKKENERAVSALGRLLGNYYGIDQGDQFTALLDRVFGLHEVKRAELHFALGESLAVAVAGFQASCTMTELDVDAQVPGQGYHETFLQMVMEKILDFSKTTKPALRKASSIWLLNIVQFCGDLAPVKDRLRDCQVAFGRLLNDRDEIVQETGSRGLGIVYEKGDKALRDDLVRDLVQSFTGSGAKMSGSVNEETELFEAGALPTEKGQSVTTYKDIVSLATEMGDPSLVYRFMNLASNNAIWSSRAAFGKFGLSEVLADSSYLSENKKFYPKLFRYRFDPNPNVQRSMNEIWRALVKDPTAVIDQNFDLIMDDLLKSVLSGREWRAREASCAAIADLVQGRDIEKFEKYLDEIWKVSFKVLDDVKESVRVAAMKLCRNLTSMLVRNLEVGQGNSKRAQTMMDHAMPFLIQQMDVGAAKDVQQYAIITLLEVVKKCPPRTLQPFASNVLETLVVSLSSLEHESINYLHMNADKYGMTADKLDEMRVSSVNASPLTEAIDRCLEGVTLPQVITKPDVDAMEGVQTSSLTPLKDAMKRLEGTFKTAIGLPSRVGLSRVIVTLVVRHPAAFRPFADRFIVLTRKHILDRNSTISIAFSTSLGYLMRLGSVKQVEATSAYAQQLYFESQDLSHRSIAGEMLQAISKTSNDVFMNFATSFLPFAFVGRNDTNEEVRQRFDTPWKDNIGGSRAVQLYLKEICVLLQSHIKSQLWPIRHACCFAVAEIATSTSSHGQTSEAEAKIIWPLLEEALSGKTWDGKEKVVTAYPTFVKNSEVLRSDAKIEAQMKQIAVREAKRTNVAYRPFAIEALGEFVSARSDLDLSEQVVPFLLELVEELGDEDAMDVDDKASDSRTRASTLESTLSAITSCLFKVLPSNARSDVLDPSMNIIRKVIMQQSTALDQALYDGAVLFLTRMLKVGSQRASNQEEKATNHAEKETEVEAFSAEMALALLTDSDSRRPYSSGSEKLRKSRVRLGLAFVESPFCTPASRGKLASILNGWLTDERSRPLREEISKAQHANAKASEMP